MNREAAFTVGLAALVGMLAMTAARRLRVPAILLLLGAGALLGSSGLGAVQPASLGRGLNVFVEFAVAVLLFEGALSLPTKVLTKHAGPIRSLLTLGAAVSLAGGAVVVHLVLGFGFTHSLLVGSILIVTGPTVVIPLLRFVRPKPALAEILRWEAILIDPIGALVAVVVLEVVVVGGGGEAFLVAVQTFARCCVVGTGLGILAGLLLERLLAIEGLIDDELRSPLALAFAFASFAVAEALVESSGLFAATIAGFTLAYRRARGLQDIEQFKGRLTAFMLAILFVLLAALMDFAAIAQVGRRGLLLLAGLFGVRFVAVTLSTLGSGLGLRDRLFLSWMSPRGVVAAAAASIFAQRLAEHGDPRADEIRTAVFCVIVGTVVIQGLTARFVARKLGLLAPEPNEVVLVGAGDFGCLLAQELAAAGSVVTLIDKNPARLLRMGSPGVTVRAEDAQSRAVVASFDPADTAFVIAATPNDEANALICSAFASAGFARVRQVPSGTTAMLRGDDHAATGYTFAFGDLALNELEALLVRGAVVRRVRVDAAETRAGLVVRAGGGFVPLAEVGVAGAARLVTRDTEEFPAGVTVIGIDEAGTGGGGIVPPPPVVAIEPPRVRLAEVGLAVAAALLAAAPFAWLAARPFSLVEETLVAGWCSSGHASPRSAFVWRGDALGTASSAFRALEAWAFGVQPSGYRVVSLALLALVAGTGYALARRLGLRASSAFVAAVLGGVVSPHAVAVGSLGGERSLVAALGLVLAAYLHRAEIRRWPRALATSALSCGAFLAALGASAAAIGLLPIVVVLELGRDEREGRRSVRWARVGLLVLAALLALARTPERLAELTASLNAVIAPADGGPATLRLLAKARLAALVAARLATPADLARDLLTHRPLDARMPTLLDGLVLGGAALVIAALVKGHVRLLGGAALALAPLALPASLVHAGGLPVAALGLGLVLALAIERIPYASVRGLVASALVGLHVLATTLAIQLAAG